MPRCGERGVFLNRGLANAMLKFNQAAAAWLRAGGPGWVPDLVHCFSWEAALTAACLAEGGGPRPATALTVDLLNLQGIVPGSMRGAGEPDFNFLEEGIRTSDLILLPSNQWLEEVQQDNVSGRLAPHIRAKCASGRARVTPFAIFPEDFREINPDHGVFKYNRVSLENRAEVSEWAGAQLRSRLGLAATKGPIFLVGNRVTENDQKNYEAVNEVMRRILTDHPATQLILRLMPGRDPTKPESDAMWGKLESLASSFAGRVAITPEGDTKVKWDILIQGADILLMPSRFEPAGLNHLQAMCVGTPVIGTARGTMAEILRDARTAADGGNGWVFKDPADWDAFEECCRDTIRAFGDSERWKRITGNAYRSVKSFEEIVHDSYLPAYRDALRRPPSREMSQGSEAHS